MEGCNCCLWKVNFNTEEFCNCLDAIDHFLIGLFFTWLADSIPGVWILFPFSTFIHIIMLVPLIYWKIKGLIQLLLLFHQCCNLHFNRLVYVRVCIQYWLHIHILGIKMDEVVAWVEELAKTICFVKFDKSLDHFIEICTIPTIFPTPNSY